jgi:hypothetical protein
VPLIAVCFLDLAPVCLVKKLIMVKSDCRPKPPNSIDEVKGGTKSGKNATLTGKIRNGAD